MGDNAAAAGHGVLLYVQSVSADGEYLLNTLTAF